jgi:hypothetical protein
MMIRCGIVVFVFAMAGIACGGDASDQASMDGPQSLQLNEVWRAGVEGNPHSLHFARPTMASRDGAGMLYVYDEMLNWLRKFDPGGELVRRVGGSGRGPGEFDAVIDILGTPGGGVIVATYDNQLIEFDADGELVSTKRLNVSMPHNRPLSISDSGTLLIAYIQRPTSDDGAPARIGLLETVSGTQIDTVAPPAISPWEHEATPGQDPVSYKQIVRWLPNRDAIVAIGSRSEVGILTPDGTLRVVQTGYQPVRYLAAEEEDWERQNRFLRVRSGAPERFPPVPEYKPTIKTVIVAPTGEVWIVRPARATGKDQSATGSIAGLPVTPRWFEPFHADVVEDSIVTKRVHGPDDLRVLAVAGDTLWGLRQGSVGEPVLVRMEAVAGDRPGS